ncbi:hypothetical protein [Pedobacter terrae]|uniref:hypothetical protein n=1 Tax=Pedobacter terrae TaxID=405671 RepID=UPI002FFD137E
MKKYILCLHCLCMTGLVSAQQDTLHQKWKTYFGLGFSLGGGGNGRLYSDIDIFLQKRNNFISIKTSGVKRFRIFYFGGLPEPRISDLSILAGKNYTFNRYHYLRLSAGLSMINQISRGTFLYDDCDRPGGCLFGNYIYETIRRRSIGLPFEIKYGLYLDGTASVTAGFSANLNKVESFYGISMGLVLGRLRDQRRKHRTFATSR